MNVKGDRFRSTGFFREGARRMLVTALKAEVDAYIAAHAGYVDSRLREHRLGCIFDFVLQMTPPRRKPQPEVFLEAVERLGVPAEEAIMAGNDLDPDILPAIAVGFRHGCWMTTRAGITPPAVTHVRTCAELARHLLS